ncbi:hypothetical protein TSUD_355990 [Trifolium subterraneum]|uniref:Uncharacterized protein n=1 Tax=Trifolium subterraneum TaxID=3900 RepID=A0A2Z6MMF4_TRISU|nr:hypothetical protein TSUD_355990 [Trifolium subterraneum]
MVLCFVNMNKDLVRVKGRGGMTPLHLASEIGEVELLAKFLTACPDSIKDVTVRGETALHIAVKHNNYEALELLVCFLRKNYKRGARKLEYTILNQKDEDHNTILHISSALSNQQKALQLLVKSGVNLKAKNWKGKTALDMAIEANVEMNRSILLSAGAKLATQVTDAPTLADKLRSTTSQRNANKLNIKHCCNRRNTNPSYDRQ